MKNLNYYIKSLFSLLLIAVFLGMAACAKKSNNGASRVQNARGNMGNVGFNQNGIGAVGGQVGATCGAGTQTYGRLVDDGSLYGSFQSNYMEFLNTELGTLDGSVNSTSTGVDFQLRVKLNGQQIIAEQSSIEISVNDSEAYQLGTIDVGFDRAVSANVNGSTGEFTLVFQDNYGQVFVQGRNMGGQVQGRVSFQNSGMSQAKSLGAFTLSSCGVFF